MNETYARKEVSKKYAPPPSPAPKASTHQSCKENTPRGATQKASQARSVSNSPDTQSATKGTAYIAVPGRHHSSNATDNLYY